MKEKLVLLWVVCLLVGFSTNVGLANWEDSFTDGQFELPDWQFPVMPDQAKTATAEIVEGLGGNHYLLLRETTSEADSGAQFGAAFGDEEVFTDVRVGAVVNVDGDASYNYYGLAARTQYIIDDGSLSGASGIIATKIYLMHVDWTRGPTNLEIDIQKALLNTNIMQNSRELGLELSVPGIAHGRSYYAELDVVGSGPVYVTGSLYEYKGGPLVARTATMVDTDALDPWEESDPLLLTYVPDGLSPFVAGLSGVFAQNEDPDPVGYRCTFDDVFSVSDGPAAAGASPANGATGVDLDADLSWIEAQFATSRQLWFGKEGAMELVDPAPTGASFDPGALELGRTYQWRVDQVGASGTVTGHTWTFSTPDCLMVEDFESYFTDPEIGVAWPHNIAGGYQYIFLSTDPAYEGAKAMKFDYQNQATPFFTEATRTFASAQDWTRYGAAALSLMFRGDDENLPQPMYVKLTDAGNTPVQVDHELSYISEAEGWHEWRVDLSRFSPPVNLAQIKKLTIGFGNGTNSGQPDKDRDTVYIDAIRLCPAACHNPEGLDLSGDVNGDCRVDFVDVVYLGLGWLNDGWSAAP